MFVFYLQWERYQAHLVWTMQLSKKSTVLRNLAWVLLLCSPAALESGATWHWRRPWLLGSRSKSIKTLEITHFGIYPAMKHVFYKTYLNCGLLQVSSLCRWMAWLGEEHKVMIFNLYKFIIDAPNQQGVGYELPYWFNSKKWPISFITCALYDLSKIHIFCSVEFQLFSINTDLYFWVFLPPYCLHFHLTMWSTVIHSDIYKHKYTQLLDKATG